jgi:hypothetical protein
VPAPVAAHRREPVTSSAAGASTKELMRRIGHASSGLGTSMPSTTEMLRSRVPSMPSPWPWLGQPEPHRGEGALPIGHIVATI